MAMSERLVFFTGPGVGTQLYPCRLSPESDQSLGTEVFVAARLERFSCAVRKIWCPIRTQSFGPAALRPIPAARSAFVPKSVPPNEAKHESDTEVREGLGKQG